MTDEELSPLAAAAMERLMAWDLTARERLIGGWIITLSFGRRPTPRMGVWIPTQGMFCRLTGIDERGVSLALASLKRAGVLDVSGPRNGPKYYAWLPNGRLVEPEPLANPEDVRMAVAEIEHANAMGAGYEPRGQAHQRRLAIVTNEERLAEEQAAGSRDTSDITSFSRLEDLSKKERSDGMIFPKRKDAAELETAPPIWSRAGETFNVSTAVPLNVKRLDVATGRSGEEEAAAPPDATYALELVRALVPEGEFKQWERKWEGRVGLRRSSNPMLKPQPVLVVRAAAEVREDLRAGRAVANPGGAIVDKVRRWLGSAAGTFRLFTL